MICFKTRWISQHTSLFGKAAVLLLLSLVVLIHVRPASAQGVGGGFGGFNMVGGVVVDADGVIKDIRPQLRQELAGTRQQLEGEVPDDLPAGVQLRKISLRALQESLLAAADKGQQLPAAVRYLSGLQRVQYVFVYPEQKDIVLAGPGEPWRINELGQAVGATNGRPVIHLQDLLVALRDAFTSNGAPISCSIEPTPEGIRNLQRKLNQFGRLNGRGGIRQVVARKQELRGKPRSTECDSFRYRSVEPICLDTCCGRLSDEVSWVWVLNQRRFAECRVIRKSCVNGLRI